LTNINFIILQSIKLLHFINRFSKFEAFVGVSGVAATNKSFTPLALVAMQQK